MATLQHPKTRQLITVPDDAVASYEEQGWAAPDSATLREEPTPSWLKANIAAYADEHGIDLEGATTKTAMLEAIAAARAAE